MPRKKAKFANFIRNSFRYLNINDSQIDEIWFVIESFDQKTENPNGSYQIASKNGHQNGQEIQIISQKRKLEDGENLSAGTPIKTAFDWYDEIKRACLKKEDHQIFLYQLEKKVINFNLF